MTASRSSSREALVQLGRVAVHELNTPVAILQHALETLEPDVRGADAREALTTIRLQIARLIGVIEDLHFRLKVLDGDLALREETFDLITCLHEQAAILEEQYPGRSVAWVAETSTAIVLADRGVTGSLLWLLLNDALRLSDQDPVQVALWPDDRDPRVHLEIQVPGARLPAARTDPLDPARPGPGLPRFGLGLGLEPAAELLNRMGGGFSVTAAVDRDGSANSILALWLPGRPQEASDG